MYKPRFVSYPCTLNLYYVHPSRFSFYSQKNSKALTRCRTDLFSNCSAGREFFSWLLLIYLCYPDIRIIDYSFRCFTLSLESSPCFCPSTSSESAGHLTGEVEAHVSRIWCILFGVYCVFVRVDGAGAKAPSIRGSADVRREMVTGHQ